MLNWAMNKNSLWISSWKSRNIKSRKSFKSHSKSIRNFFHTVLIQENTLMLLSKKWWNNPQKSNFESIYSQSKRIFREIWICEEYYTHKSIFTLNICTISSVCSRVQWYYCIWRDKFSNNTRHIRGMKIFIYFSNNI